MLININSMIYPSISEYVEAIKSAEDNFDKLSSLRPVLNEEGEPIISCGNFSVVFKVKDVIDGKLYALKCFIKDQNDRFESYRLIAEELGSIQSDYFCHIEYFNNELFVDSRNSNESEFPVLKMDWIEGKTLDKYVIDNRYDAYLLANLVYNFYELSKWLLLQPFAHGDLKPDNIIVDKKGNLVLVDYDGMYVPKMSGQKSRESGSPDYRNPFNNNFINSLFNKEIDTFAIVHILLSLKVYSLHPMLINKDRDFALFNHDDFKDIYESNTYKNIISFNIDSQISILLLLFNKLILFGRIDKSDWQLIKFEKPMFDYVNMEDLMCSLDNIVLAVNLAYFSMCFKDPARNEYEINTYSDSDSRIKLAVEIQHFLEDHEWPYDEEGIKYFCLKPNGIEKREGIALSLTEYTLRYLFGIVKYIAIKKKIPSCIFGGGNDVFVENNDFKKYENYLSEFVKIQESCAKRYKNLYVFDIRNFFHSVDLCILINQYFGTDFTNVAWYDKLFIRELKKGSVMGLNPCSEVDFFFANLYLQPLDKVISQIDGIEYYRYNDDIRIFSNRSDLCDELNSIMTSLLAPLSLKLNNLKTKQIDTANDKLDLAKACFVWSCVLYIEKSDKSTDILDGKGLAEILDNDMSFVYISDLLEMVNGRATEANGSLNIHLDNLFYILKNVHKNATLYRLTSDLIFDLGVYYNENPLLFSDILENIVKIMKDNKVEPFVKYWMLREFFCSDKKYYKCYENKELVWKDQYWYAHPSYIEQIHDLLDSFRDNGDFEILINLSDYIISIIQPYSTEEDIADVNDLPF